MQLASAQQQLSASRKQVVVGAATASDSLTAVTLIATAEVALIQAQAARRDANAAITRLTGSDVPLSADIADPTIIALDTLHVDSTTVVNLAARGPTVGQAEAQLAAAHARVQAAHAAYIPTVSANYSRTGSGTGDYGFGPNPFPYQGQLSLSLNVPIFNGFSREQQVAVATVNETNAAATLRDTQLAARQLALQYLDALRVGQQQVALQRASILAAQENLRVVQQRYDLGLATIVDLLTAQTTLNQAQANLIAAHNAVRLATAEIEALVAQPVRTLTPGSAGIVR